MSLKQTITHNTFMKIYILLLTIMFLVLITHSALSQGSLPIVQHFGANNPTTEGFSLESYGNPHLGPVINDLGMNAWSVQMSSSDAAQYGTTLTSQQKAAITGANWSLSLDLRIIEAPTTPSYDISVDFGTGAERFQIYFGEEPNGDPAVQVGGSSLSPVFVLNGVGSSYNDYQLLYNATADTASLWVDGTDAINDIIGGQLNGNAYLSWSAYQHGDNVEANWNLVSLSVPEPSAVSLVSLGSGVFIYVRRAFSH